MSTDKALAFKCHADNLIEDAGRLLSAIAIYRQHEKYCVFICQSLQEM
jgi:hypothetical protein